MGCQSQVVVVAVQLCVVAGTSDKLIHGLQLQVASFEEIVHPYGRHVQETVFVCSVTVEQVIAQRCLHAGSDEVTALYVTADIIVMFVDLLAFGKAYVHPIGFGCQI